MRIARFWLNDEARYGVVDGPELRVLEGHPLVNGYEYTGDRIAIKEVKLLAPTVPSKMFASARTMQLTRLRSAKRFLTSH